MCIICELTLTDGDRHSNVLTAQYTMTLIIIMHTINVKTETIFCKTKLALYENALIVSNNSIIPHYSLL